MRISDWSSDVCSSDLLGKIAGFEMPAEAADQPQDVAADERLAAGQAQLPHAEPDEGAAQPVEFLEREHLGLRQEAHILRHAVHAAQIAPVRHRYAQVADLTAKRVEHGGLPEDRKSTRLNSSQ